MLQVYVDDSPGQNRRVMQAIAARYDLDRQQADTKAIIDRHHEFQLHLQKLPLCQVGIPYAPALADHMPAGNPKVRRAIKQVLTVIEALVLVQYDQREEKNNARLATLDDYATARKLLLGPLHAAMGVGKHFKYAEQLRVAIPEPEFSRKEVGSALKLNNETMVGKVLNSLVEDGLLERLNQGKKGLPSNYRWVDGVKANLETMVLPTSDQLQKFVNS
jgi:hypothetical protein